MAKKKAAAKNSTAQTTQPAAKSTTGPKPDNRFEESLWDSANRLRGSVESSEYKHVVLSLIFLKFVSDKFEERRAQLIAEGKQNYTDVVEFYTMQNVFYLPETSRWSHIQQHAKQGDIAIKIDSALAQVEKSNASLKGALPDNYFSRLGLDGSKLSALIDAINNIDTVADKEEDVVGRVYEYFLGKFAASEGKLGGEFYTPKCVVNLIAEMIEPFKGKIYDPCCGSGGMFVQSLKFVKSHHGNTKDISVYGQEFTATTYKLAKMNLAVRGLSANLGDVPADSFFKDQHPDLKADYIMANPPFNMKDWRAADELTKDSRWDGYETPPTGNANYAWILHMVSKLSTNGVAGFVLANGSMSTNTTGEGAIRQKLVENDLVDCMIALPGQLFYTTQIPVCLWFLTRSKKADKQKGYRNREGQTLFIDARQIGSMISRTQKELTEADIARIAKTYHAWRGDGSAVAGVARVQSSLDQTPSVAGLARVQSSLDQTPSVAGLARVQSSLDQTPSVAGLARVQSSLDQTPSVAGLARVQSSAAQSPKSGDSGYADQPGYCKSATLDEIRKHDFVLTPGRYVGAADLEDDGIPFETKMTEMTQLLYQQMEESSKLDEVIRRNLEVLGYGK